MERKLTIPHIVVLNIDDAVNLNKVARYVRPEQGLNQATGLWDNYYMHFAGKASGSYEIDWHSPWRHQR
jgi:hypothetical protein